MTIDNLYAKFLSHGKNKIPDLHEFQFVKKEMDDSGYDKLQDFNDPVKRAEKAKIQLVILTKAVKLFKELKFQLEE